MRILCDIFGHVYVPDIDPDKMVIIEHDDTTELKANFDHMICQICDDRKPVELEYPEDFCIGTNTTE